MEKTKTVLGRAAVDTDYHLLMRTECCRYVKTTKRGGVTIV